MRKSFIMLFALLLSFVTACSDQSVWHGKDRGGSEKSKPDPMLSFKAATSIEGMLKEGPGKYAEEIEPTGYTPTLPDSVRAKLRTFSPKLNASEAYNRLIYLLAQDYQPIAKKIDQYDSRIPLSSQRKSAPKSVIKSPVHVNIALVIDASSVQQKKVNSEQTRFDTIKQKIKEAIHDVLNSGTNGLEYSISIHTYGGKVDKDTSFIKIAGAAPGQSDDSMQELTSALDGVKLGGASKLSDALSQVQIEFNQKNSPNDVNQVFVVSSSLDAIDDQALTKTKELLYSEGQAQVSTLSYDSKDNKLKEKLDDIAFAGLGESREVDKDSGFNFKDQSTGIGDDFGLFETNDLYSYTWAEIMKNRKRNQLLKLDPKFNFEYEILTAAAEELKISQSEKDLLLQKITNRRDRLKDYLQGKLETLIPEK
ncbi:hypothetical protein SAMN05444392_10994 [Seinonella peptonophila]|uniref:VWFA domain-containing protein n=1 Tax=Seinonella peptonophila TaxID=112248 RepID=A0A1M4ZJN9_9BACL|nr:VWA domain-containing protein [Seinonella peptonophila]SHF18211.1 hypothetical protein SAMN05444392_10994 [Seinonella peptonophila]